MKQFLAITSLCLMLGGWLFHFPNFSGVGGIFAFIVLVWTAVKK